MELMVVAAILMFLLVIVGILVIPRNIERARDAKRKSQLEEYKIQFEAYHTDKKRYPPVEIMDTKDDCGSQNLSPYMDRILCDPATGEPYYYQVSEDGQHYWLYTNLLDATDPAIYNIGCAAGCGPDNNGDGVGDYNYGVADGALEGQDIDTNDPSSYCQCIPGRCGTCCPGSKYRCNADASGCYLDLSCTSGN